MKSNRDYAIAFVLVAASLGVLFWIARPPAAPGGETASAAASLSAGELTYDFGAISMANGVVSHAFNVRNTTAEPITIRKIYTSCMCTTATLVRGERRIGPFGMPGHGLVPQISETIAPGEEGMIEAVFDPAAHGPAGVGRIERSVFVESGGGRPLTLNFSATVKP